MNEASKTKVLFRNCARIKNQNQRNHRVVGSGIPVVNERPISYRYRSIVVHMVGGLEGGPKSVVLNVIIRPPEVVCIVYSYAA